MAGASLQASQNPAKAPGNEDWASARDAERFLATSGTAAIPSRRVLYPDQLLEETTVEAQGGKLGRR